MKKLDANLSEIQDRVREDGDIADALDHWVVCQLNGISQAGADEYLLRAIHKALQYHEKAVTENDDADRLYDIEKEGA